MVHARLAALVSGIGGKIKHVPHMVCPHKGTLFEAFQHIFVIDCLILLGMVAPAGMRRMEIGHTLAAVFRETQAAVGILPMEEIDPKIVKEQTRHIPAKVQIPADQIGNMGNFVERSAHRVASKRGRTGGIHFMNQVIQHPVVVQHILFVLGGNGDLVGKTPCDDAGMVVVLHDQLFHLIDGILPSRRHMLRDVGNLCPDHHAVFVAQIVKILIVLIVGKANGIGTDLPDQSHILVVMLFCQCIAQALAVLVPGNTLQRIAASVEEEAFLGIKMIATDTEIGLHAVGILPIHLQHCLTAVQIGILQAVPQMHIVNGQGHIRTSACRHLIALGIQQGHQHLGIFCIVPSADTDFAVGTGNLRGHRQTGAAVIIQIKMIFIYNNQLYIPVDTAVESEVCFLGVDPVVDRVICLHHQVIHRLQIVGNVRPEGRIAAVMGHDLLIVQRHLCRSIDTLKLQIDPLILPVKFRSRESLCVDAGTTPVVVSTVLPVYGIPSVRQIHSFHRLAGSHKRPFII